MPQFISSNAEKSYLLAKALFPQEEWIPTELLETCILTKKHSVFIWLLSDISIGSVKAKIAGELKNRQDEGNFICYFEKTGALHTWTYDELRAIIGS
jgi:hypothetical protein